MKTNLKTLALLAVVGMAGVAKADIVPILDSVAVSGGGYSWNYNAELHQSQKVWANIASANKPVSYFTIYDFEGFTGSVTTPSDWTYSVQNTGITPTGITPTEADDATKPNITFTYIGTVTLFGPQTFGLFGIESTIGPTQKQLVSFTSRAIKNAPGTLSNNTVVSNRGDVEGPGAIVPLPAASWMGLALLGGLAGFRAFRRTHVA
jgi:hypothetical protein